MPSEPQRGIVYVVAMRADGSRSSRNASGRYNRGGSSFAASIHGENMNEVTTAVET